MAWLTCPPEQLLDNENQAFDLPISVRDTVSVILVVHPVATLLVLVMFIMAAASHLHGPGHSARYLLILFILILITFLVCLLAFLVDVLLFIPHLSMGSYMVLTATIILGLSGIASCAMRRAVVSRLAHRRRIDENAEMSGQNYFAREGPSKPSPAATNHPTLPMVSGGKRAVDDNLPQFASYEHQKKGDSFSDDGVPLTQRSSSAKAPAAMPYAMANPAQATVRRAPPPRDPYALASNAPPRGDLSAGGGFRRRGSVGHDRRGSMQGRGGYGPPPRDVYGSRGAHNNDGAQSVRRPSAEATYYGQQPPNPGWYAEANTAPPTFRNDYEAYAPEADLPRAESPPSILAADPSGEGTQPMQSGADAPLPPDQYGPIRDSDMVLAGMVSLQQDRPLARHDTLMTEGSRYSTDE